MSVRRLDFSAGVAFVGFMVACQAPAQAQSQSSSVLIEPAIPQDFNKGRNVSVEDKLRPDYDALGIRTGAFLVYPSITAYAGITSNVVLSGVDAKADGFVGTTPAVRVESDWSRHQIRLRGRADLQRYLDTPRRNQNNWEVAGVGRLDVHSDITLNADAQFSRVFETPFSGGIQSDFTILSSYFRAFSGLRGSYQSGQFRATLAADRTSFDFSALDIGAATKSSQRERDRVIWRGTAQGEYALTPSTSFFAQAGYERVGYKIPLFSGDPNRSADVLRILGGVNLDLAGLLRGSLGVGFTNRSFDAPTRYKKLNSLTAEAKLEYFPSELTTLTFLASRTIEDSNIIDTTGYYDNRVSAKVDHEVMRNMILSAMAEYSHQNYIGTDFVNDVYGVRAGARYLANRTLSFNSTLSYTNRNRSGGPLGADFDELRFLAGITLQR